MLRIPEVVVFERCRKFDLQAFYERDWSPASELPRRILGVDLPEGQYPMCFFHATRIIPGPPLFAAGVLPLRDAIGSIWDALLECKIASLR